MIFKKRRFRLIDGRTFSTNDRCKPIANVMHHSMPLFFGEEMVYEIRIITTDQPKFSKSQLEEIEWKLRQLQKEGWKVKMSQNKIVISKSNKGVSK